MKCTNCGGTKFTRGNVSVWCDYCGFNYVEIPEKNKMIYLVMELDDQRHAVFEPVHSFLSRENADECAERKNKKAKKDRYHVETLVIEDWGPL